MTQNSYTREDIGLTLKVKPRISADDKVSLEVKVSLEDVVGGSAGLPTTTKSEVETTSIVTNGETVIISGLAKDKKTDNVSKIPILGDIPILGIPFRYATKDKSRSNLLIMLTPYIIKRSEDLATIREILGRMDLMEDELALEFQKNHQSLTSDLHPELSDESDYHFRIDEFGVRTKIYTDSNGHEIRREQIVNPDF
jgi:general secretion pathway protein D